jgi:predicted MPP superfamily phosphohydrolase
MTINHRRFLKYSASIISASFLSMLTYGVLKNEFRHPIVERIKIPIKDLPPSFVGFRIAQISDIHLKPIVTTQMVRKTVKMVNDLKPDLIVITGDFVTRFISGIYELAPELAKLNAPHGVFASLGNHDIWVNAKEISNTLQASGISVLVNQGVPIQINDESLWLAGVDDAICGNPNLNQAIVSAPEQAPVVLLGHEPDLADEFSKDGRVDLMLAGHSHGGQIRLPFKNISFKAHLAEKYDMGLYKVNGMWLYVNRGIGVITSVPIRINCPPEISSFTLEYDTVGMDRY